MQKERFDIIASSLSSYFGVGFNTPQEQFNYDLGIEPKIFDDEAQDRMDLGNAMENACMDYFEKRMGIKIDERNTATAYACNGKLKCKRDGRTFLEGVETGWENKYSNSSKGSFTDDLGYIIQCQAYMMAFGLSQWVLAGMWQGKPVYRLIVADPEIQADIETVVDAVFSVLNGLNEVEDFCWEIVEKYSKSKELKILDETTVDKTDKDILLALAQLKTKKSEIEKKIEELSDYVKVKFADCMYNDGSYKYTITTSEGKTSFDKARFSIENPTIDLSKYEKTSEPYRTIRTTIIKNK